MLEKEQFIILNCGKLLPAKDFALLFKNDRKCIMKNCQIPLDFFLSFTKSFKGSSLYVNNEYDLKKCLGCGKLVINSD